MLGRLKVFVKILARGLLGDYTIYYIYSILSERAAYCQPKASANLHCAGIDDRSIEASAESLIREQSYYGGFGAAAYACFDGGRIVGVCFYWFGDRYSKRNFWPLQENEAKLVQIITLPDMRGCGVARALIAFSSKDMRIKNFRRLFARIWHSNTSSLRAFEYAGWTRIATVIEINPFRRSRPIRIILRA